MHRDVLDHHIFQQDMRELSQREIGWQHLCGRTVLITGATGMLGSYFVYFLLWLNEYKGANIRLLLLVRDLAKCRLKFGAYVDSPYVMVSISDINFPLQVTEHIDYIVHAASLASPQYYTSMPVEVAAPNVLGTYQVLQLARQKQVKGVVFFSSGDVYGAVTMGAESISEDRMGVMNPLDLHSCYGESKRMGETWCMAFAHEYQVPVKIARIAHTYGPTMDLEKDPRVFASFVKCVVDGRDIVMLSDGTAKRPFCYLADAVAGFLLILLNGIDGEAYNVCNEGQFVSIATLADILVNLRPEKNLKVIKRQRVSEDGYLENSYNRDNLPTAKKLRELGWNCQYTIEMGFSRVLDYLEKGAD